jgi:hypothetical protein
MYQIIAKTIVGNTTLTMVCIDQYQHGLTAANATYQVNRMLFTLRFLLFDQITLITDLFCFFFGVNSCIIIISTDINTISCLQLLFSDSIP